MGGQSKILLLDTDSNLMIESSWQIIWQYCTVVMVMMKTSMFLSFLLYVLRHLVLRVLFFLLISFGLGLPVPVQQHSLPCPVRQVSSRCLLR
jgi:hypothetical protein